MTDKEKTLAWIDKNYKLFINCIDQPSDYYWAEEADEFRDLIRAETKRERAKRPKLTAEERKMLQEAELIFNLKMLKDTGIFDKARKAGGKPNLRIRLPVKYD